MSCTTNNKITVVRGDTHTIHLNIKANDLPLDLTGAIVFFTVKQDLNDPDSAAQIAKTISDFDDPESGEVNIILDEDDTNRVGEYYYDIQIKQGSTGVVSSKRGKFIIEQDVTLRIS